MGNGLPAPYETLEQFVEWMFEHEGTLVVKPGSVTGSKSVQITISEPVRAVAQYTATEEQLEGRPSTSFELLRMAWIAIDRGLI